ncbi:MAG: IS200/IS605 family transposase [Bacteroidetes bacterium]|nr:IS200/IS605 family transposase [Bacteroidota bacterium]
MRHVYYKIWIHLVWSVKNRYPFLNDEIRHKIFKHISDKAEEKGFFIDIINGYSDHCHVLISLNPKYSISEVVNNYKGESSHWINSEKLTSTHFAWQ